MLLCLRLRLRHPRNKNQYLQLRLIRFLGFLDSEQLEEQEEQEREEQEREQQEEREDELHLEQVCFDCVEDWLPDGGPYAGEKEHGEE